MEEKKNSVFVPFKVFESERARHEREKIRRFIIELVLILLLFGTNAAWIAYEAQFTDESWSYEATSDGNSTAIANGDGEVYFYGGASEGNSSAQDP